VGPRTAEVDRRGFTLLEVLVVLFIVALAVSLAAPSITRSTDLIKARAEVASVLALLRFAREQAITLHQQESVVIDPVERRVALVAPGGEVRRSRVFSPKWTIEAEPSTHLSVSFEPEGSSSGGDFRFTANGVTYRVTVEPMTGRVRSARQ
jgi:general secretion pathway protein H